MTVLTSTHQHPGELSLLSDQDYLDYWRGLEDELTERYYARGLTPPGGAPLPSSLTALTPPF